MVSKAGRLGAGYFGSYFSRVALSLFPLPGFAGRGQGEGSFLLTRPLTPTLSPQSRGEGVNSLNPCWRVGLTHPDGGGLFGSDLGEVQKVACATIPLQRSGRAGAWGPLGVIIFKRAIPENLDRL